MHRTLLLLLLLLNYFTDMFHICMIQWNNNKYEYKYSINFHLTTECSNHDNDVGCITRALILLRICI